MTQNQTSTSLTKSSRVQLSKDLKSHTITEHIPTSPKSSRWIQIAIFFIIVVIPSCVVGFYWLFIASDQYEAEARLVVRTIGIGQTNEDAEGASGGSILAQSPTQDTFIANNFIESTELVKRLEEKLELRTLFSRPEIDSFSRLKADASIEELVSYWNRQISTYIDGPSGIIVFAIRAFSPEDALLIAQATLEETNKLIDALSERAKRDLVTRAETEVQKAFENYNAALLGLRNYQNETGILDPIANATLVGRLLANLIGEKLRVDAQLTVMEANGVRTSPVYRQLKELQASLEQQIELQKETVTSKKETDGKLSAALVNFSRLETNRLVAETIYTAAQRGLDLAKSTALRRTTYLAVFSSPDLPQTAQYPKRFSTSLLVALALAVMWMTLVLVWLSIEDHRK